MNTSGFIFAINAKSPHSISQSLHSSLFICVKIIQFLRCAL